MKRFLVLSILIATIPVAFAYVEEEKASSPEFIRSHGFSAETARLVETAKSNADANGATPAVVINKAPDDNWGKVKFYYHKLRIYIDPAADDGGFGKHNPTFNNTYTNL